MKTSRMSEKLDTRVIQVTNVAPSCTNEQLRTLFSYLGRVKELKVYPPENTEGVVARVGYVEFDDTVTTGVALHLSSTVFIDRALMIVPVMDGRIPDETTALQLTPQAVAGMLPGQPTWPANVVSQVTGTGSNQIITTYDPRLTSLGLPQYPSLPITTDASKIEEIRRTVYVSDLDPKVTAEMLLGFFSQVGEIKYIRLAGDERAAARAAYIEFTDQRSVAQALTYNNVVFQGRTISVQHSKANIVKPSGKVNEASQREIDEAMKKVKEASKLISAAASDSKKGSRSPSRKRSRSKSKRRSRSPSPPRRTRSRSKGRRSSRSRTNRRSRSHHRSPRRSRTPLRRRRSRSRGRVVPPVPAVPRRSRSRERRRSRTRSPPIRRRRSRTRSKSRRRSRTPPKSYSKRSPSRNRRSRSRSKRRSRSRDRKEKAKERKKSVSLSPPRLERNGSIPPKVDDEDDKVDSPKKLDFSAVTGGEGDKPIRKIRSPTPVKSRRRSPSPRKRSRSRSPGRRKRRRRTKSPSPRKRSKSRSPSRHSRSKRERSKRSRSRDRKHDSKKKAVREKEEKKKESTSSMKVKRDYDEEEKGFASGSDRIREDSEPRSSGSPPALEPEEKDSDHQPVDMDMSD